MAQNMIYSTRNHKFLINEWLDIQKILELPKFKGVFELDDFGVIIDESLRFTKGLIQPTVEDGDKIGPQIVDGQVKLPESWHKAYWAMYNNGWGVQDQEAEGVLPNIVILAFKEIMATCNPAFTMLASNTAQGVANIIQKFGRPEDYEKFLPNFYSGKFNGTMCITEPNAGSDAGDAVTKAIPTDDPQIWKISGTKVFISGGDFDIPDNIIHLVLARPVGGASGTRGLSLFIVPKLWINEDGSMVPNDVTIVSLEHKLGFRGAATVQLSFGDENNCRGILLGNPPDENGTAEGMSQMFQMMNGKRYEAGRTAGAMAILAYNYAVDYAKIRVQGRTLINPKGPRVRLIEHEDIRRLLLHIKAHGEAIQAIIYKCAWYRDLVQYSEDPEERKMASRRIDVLTPIVKAYGSDVVWQLVAEAIQIHGGYGYSEDYSVARIARDCKVMSLFEGTTYIQAMDLVGRKWSMDKGRVFQEWFDELIEFADSNQNTLGLEQEFGILNQSIETYKEIFTTVKGYYAENVQLVGSYATRVLTCTGMVTCSMYLLDIAKLAQKKMAELGKDHWEYSYYQGKVMSARYYIKNVLPQIGSLNTIIKTADTSAIEISEEAF